ncbi:MAG: TRAP transporter substrate-binding protein [Tepidimonas sp.]|uniref:TRAP transporter substrate-binding protein n=1 Tax=Tepidimonas sp. TaxID=2002775 RepID=UPI00298EF4EB|nr:TRAP transporter substrate-binding protein [Tepidimonas sp.]MCS6811663.1 TRAP transporter substrate-binding protein [Tepidimonas sp.]MDW8336979.1 TRAP transporter substrate-binding protein [Tepidimonas sp.]
MKRKFLQSMLVTVTSLALAAVVQAQPRTIKFANQNAKGHPIVQGMDKFAELVEQKSGGRLKVQVFAGGALGSDQANVSALQGGTLEMAAMNSGIFASVVKEFAVYDFPFMFASPREADVVLDGPFGRQLHAKLEEKGLVGLAYYELGFRHITNNRRPIQRVEDIAGLKLRVIPNPINVDWVSALGANPTPLPFPELYAALEQRAVDGQENPLATIWGAKFYEVQKYLTLTYHQYNPQSVVVSKKFWDSLSAEDRRILQEAAVESARFQREQARSAVAGTLDNLKKAGMQVTELPAAEVAKMRERMKPVIAKHTAAVGEATVAALQAELDKLRK